MPLESYRPQVAKPGYRESMAWMWRSENTGGSPSLHYVGCIISVLDTKGGQVRLAVRARQYAEIPKPKVLEQDLGNLKGHEYGYVPGETMQIPIEGGGTLVLSGEVSDRQPQFTWGFPVEPAANQMILRNFALIRGKQVLSPVTGWATMIDEKGKGISLYVPGEGLFTFALEPFEGAIKGEANWSEAKFKIGGQRYYLLSLAQITGGDQPHDIWVSLKTDYAAPKQMERGALFLTPNLRVSTISRYKRIARATVYVVLVFTASHGSDQERKGDGDTRVKISGKLRPIWARVAIVVGQTHSK